jgi:hypothetical protein
MKTVTFEDLARLEPRLQSLLEEARRHHNSRRPDFCANAVWYGYAGHLPGLKPRLLFLVGYERRDRHPVLSTSLAYDVAYDTIYQALPDCRGRCACFSVLDKVA